MTYPGKSDVLAGSAATMLVRIMWVNQRNSLWDEMETWFARMWSTGDPAEEDKVREQLRAGVRAMAPRNTPEPHSHAPARAVEPQELTRHWARVIETALREGRFSREALAGFLDAFREPGDIAARILDLELRIEHDKTQLAELRNRRSQVWFDTNDTGRELAREEREGTPERLRHAQELFAEHNNLQRNAQQELQSARSEFKAAERRLEVWEKGFNEGRRTTEDIEEAHRQKNTAEQRFRAAKATLAKLRQEQKAEKDRRRAAPTAADRMRANRAEAERVSSEFDREIAEAETRVTAKQQQLDEAHAHWRLQTIRSESERLQRQATTSANQRRAFARENWEQHRIFDQRMARERDAALRTPEPPTHAKENPRTPTAPSETEPPPTRDTVPAPVETNNDDHVRSAATRAELHALKETMATVDAELRYSEEQEHVAKTISDRLFRLNAELPSKDNTTPRKEPIVDHPHATPDQTEDDPNATMAWTPDFGAPVSAPRPDTAEPDDPQATVRFRPEWAQEPPADDA